MLIPNSAPHTPTARAGGDEQAEVGRDGAQQRAEGEQRQAALEDPPSAEPVGGRARQHQQAGDDQGVGVDRPLQAREGRVKRAMDRRQRDVDDRRVQPHDQQAQRADAEDDEPRPAIRRGLVDTCGVGTHF
jgi:hypothetical protein